MRVKIKLLVARFQPEISRWEILQLKDRINGEYEDLTIYCYGTPVGLGDYYDKYDWKSSLVKFMNSNIYPGHQLCTPDSFILLDAYIEDNLVVLTVSCYPGYVDMADDSRNEWVDLYRCDKLITEYGEPIWV